MELIFNDAGDGHTLTVSIVGIMDISTIDRFYDHFIVKETVQRVEFNMERLQFIDSTGVGALLDVILSYRDQEVHITFTGMSLLVKDIFETVGVLQIIESS